MVYSYLAITQGVGMIEDALNLEVRMFNGARKCVLMSVFVYTMFTSNMFVLTLKETVYGIV